MSKVSEIFYTYFPSKCAGLYDISRKIIYEDGVLRTLVAKDVDMSHIKGNFHQGILKDKFNEFLSIEQ